MSYSVGVYLPEHLELINQVPENPDGIDKWIEECAKLRLYDAPLGSGGVIYEYWTKIAQELDLPLIGSMYDVGLKLNHSEVPKLEVEMDKLERYWEENRLSGVGGFAWTQSSARKELKERLGYLREAANVAKQNHAVLIIS